MNKEVYGEKLNSTNNQGNVPLDPNKYWASAALLQLCKHTQQNHNDVSHLTKLLTTPIDAMKDRRIPRNDTLQQSATGKLYRSKKRTLRSLQRRFSSEEVLSRLAQKHYFKRSLSIDGKDGLSANLKQNLTIDTKEILKNDALSKHLGNLTRLVDSIGPKSYTNHKSPFYNVLANYNPFQNGAATFTHPDKTIHKQEIIQMHAYCNNGFHITSAPFASHDAFNAFHDNYNVRSPIPLDYCSYPCSPAVYTLDTPLSASAPSLHDLIADLRKNSTDEELKSSFEDIHVGDDFFNDDDDAVFHDLLTTA